MSYNEWQSAVIPKVQGSWNLHALLPKGLDFFILLSSVSGIIGQRGQANYAAGNTYMDALAHHRTSHGEKAISVDLGAMVSDGYLANNKEIMDRILSYGSMLPITRSDFYSILDYYCDPSLPILSSVESQSVVGMATPAQIRAQGRDEPAFLHSPLFRHMYALGGGGGGGDSGPAPENMSNEMSDVRKSLAEADSLAQAGHAVAEALVAKLARSLPNLRRDEVDLGKPLHAYGVDSLLAVEVRSWIVKECRADVAVFEILGGTSFAALGAIVAGKTNLRTRKWD